jgi:hypothetical protein
MPLCEIIYVKHKEGNGWKWRPITDDAQVKPSEKTYELFYECVTAARASGFDPNQKYL